MQTPETSTDMEEAPEMRTPEDVAREIVCVRDYPDDDNGGMCRAHLTSGWPCNHRDVEILADLIRARDAEVRAETLAGFTEERAKFWEHDEGTGRLRRASTGVVCTRLVGPWEPMS